MIFPFFISPVSLLATVFTAHSVILLKIISISVIAMKSIFYLSLAVASYVSAAPTTNAGCTALQAEFSTKLALPTDAAYTEANEAYFDQRSVLSPGCIFLPKTAEDVAGAVKILKKTGTQFAVKSGGHMVGKSLMILVESIGQELIVINAAGYP